MMKQITALSTLLLVIILFSMIFTVGSAQDFGSNWTGQFYSNTTWSGSPALVRVDAAINFNWGAGSPQAPQVPTDNFSVRWTGVQTFSEGTYEFIASFDDGMRVVVDGNPIINSMGAGPLQTLSTTIALTAGSHTIVVEYVEFTGNAIAQLQWRLTTAPPVGTVGPSPTPGPTNTPQPTSLPSIPAGSITGTVIKASVLNVRDAPSLGGGIINRILRGQTYRIVGRNPQATWFLLQLSNMQGWAFGYYLYIDGNEFVPPIVSFSSLTNIPGGVSDTGVVTQALAGMKMRAAPTVASEQTGRIIWGSFLPVVGKTANGLWYQVVWKGTIGWVYSPFLKQLTGDLGNVPIR